MRKAAPKKEQLPFGTRLVRFISEFTVRQIAMVLLVGLICAALGNAATLTFAKPVYSSTVTVAVMNKKGSKVSNCIIADGCVMMGTALDSVIFREVVIEQGASVKSCIIMQGAKIEEGAQLECVILDKDVTVTKGASLKGTPKNPVIVIKGEVV